MPYYYIAFWVYYSIVLSTSVAFKFIFLLHNTFTKVFNKAVVLAMPSYI